MEYQRKCKSTAKVPYGGRAEVAGALRAAPGIGGGGSRLDVMSAARGEPDPGRRVITRFLTAAHPVIDVGVEEAGREIGTQQQVIDSQTRVALEVIAKEVPERVEPFLRMAGAQGIHPALIEQTLVGGAGLRLQQRVLPPAFRIVDIGVGRHHVVVSR